MQNQAIAEEGEVEYISDEDEEEHGYQTDRIILPSPRVSVEEHEVGFSSQRNIISAVTALTVNFQMPILVRNSTSFEERIMAANPEAAAPVELQPCDTCGRKFNPTALERHAKVR